MLWECAHLDIVVARHSHCIGHQLQGALHLLEASLLEEVRLEQRLQHRPHLVAGVDVRLRQRVHRIRIVWRRVRPRRHLRLVRDEEVVKVPAQELPGRRLLHDDVNDVFAVEVARLAEERLLAVVVVPVAVLEARMIEQIWHSWQRIGVCPARECASRHLHIVLGVVADAHREQLHQLAAIVLVWRAIVVVAVVQPVDHSWVPGNLQQQFAEVPHRMGVQHFVVSPHRRPGVQLGESRSKHAVPEQRHLLFQRATRIEDAIQPAASGADKSLRLHMHWREPQRNVIVRLRLAHRIQQPVNGRVISPFCQRLDLVIPCAKTCSSHQVRYQGSIIR